MITDQVNRFFCKEYDYLFSLMSKISILANDLKNKGQCAFLTSYDHLKFDLDKV